MLPKMLSTAAVTLWLGACVFHIDSAIPDEFVTYNQALAGRWVAGDDTMLITRAAREPIYHIRHAERGEDTLYFRARVGRLGEHTVAEIWPGEWDDGHWPFGRMLVVFEIANDQMKTSFLEADSIRSALERGALQLSHLDRNGDVTLTAPTSDLAVALTAYLRRPGVLTDEQSWHRVRK